MCEAPEFKYWGKHWGIASLLLIFIYISWLYVYDIYDNPEFRSTFSLRMMGLEWPVCQNIALFSVLVLQIIVSHLQFPIIFHISLLLNRILVFTKILIKISIYLITRPISRVYTLINTVGHLISLHLFYFIITFKILYGIIFLI